MSRRSQRFLFISRDQGARLLRAARNAQPHSAAERVGWAVSAMKDCRAAQRLKIDHLLNVGNFDAADAMLARHLLTGTEHPLMRLRFARSMFMQGRFDAAQREVERVIQERPHHVGAKVLAARVASASGHARRAVEHLLIACGLRPCRSDLKASLLEALVSAGLADHAARLLPEPPRTAPALAARIMTACGRPLDAIAIVEDALGQDGSVAEQRDCFVALIEALEGAGWTQRLLQLLGNLESHPDLAADERQSLQLNAAAACARLGCPLQATERAERSLQSNSSSAAHMLLGVAEAFQGNLTEAADRLAEAMTTSEGDQGKALAMFWLGGLVEQVLNDQTRPARLSADLNVSPLHTMMRSASDVLGARVRDPKLPPDDLDALQNHQAILQRALNQGGMAA